MSSSSWTCSQCTYVHNDAEAQFLCCAICSAEQPKLHAAAPATEPAAALAAPRPPAAARPRAKPPAGAKPRVSLSLQRPGRAPAAPPPPRPAARLAPPPPTPVTRPAPPPPPAPTPPVNDVAAPPPSTAKKKPLAPLFLPKKRAAPAPAPARPPLKAPRTAAAWPIQSQRTVALRFAMARDGEGRVRASIARGGSEAPAAGRRRVFEAERTCKLALAHEGKAACDVKIHLTLDTAGDDGAAWRDRRTYTGARTAGGLGLLQSHLQKCVRRGNVDLAVRSAHELAGITFGPTDPAGVKMLVRRLPVIAVGGLRPFLIITCRGDGVKGDSSLTQVEDSAALPCVLPAVWYMMAMSPTEKSPATYKPTDQDVLVLCACAAQLAAHGSRDRFPPPRKGRNELPTDGTNLALLIRAAYGGMKGDVTMLKERAHSTAASDEANTSPWLAPVAAPPVLRPGDWLLEGVDFHQKGGEILGRMRAKDMALQSVSDEDLKRWIWHTRSSVNRRDAPREPSPPPVWADAAARAADAAARDMIANAWRGYS